jgi:hypothetical protein
MTAKQIDQIVRENDDSVFYEGKFSKDQLGTILSENKKRYPESQNIPIDSTGEAGRVNIETIAYFGIGTIGTAILVKTILYINEILTSSFNNYIESLY